MAGTERRNKGDVRYGVIRKSSSPYASPVVIVKKKDGSNGICVDYRKLNKVTILNLEPIKTSENLFLKLAKSRFLSKMDLSKGYWQIPVAEEDVFKTAFVTPDETDEFLRMSFSMKNSGATLVRGIREVLSGISGIESYIDDLIVFSSDWKTHLRTLEELLRRLSEANLTAQPSKCIFGASTVEFLGHDVGYDWITPNNVNLDKVARAKSHEEESPIILWVARVLSRLYSFLCNYCGTVNGLNEEGGTELCRMG